MRLALVIATAFLLFTAGSGLQPPVQATTDPTTTSRCCCSGSATTDRSTDSCVATKETEVGTLFLMGAAHTPGFNGTQWRTSLEVCNFGGITRSYHLGLLLRGRSNPDPSTVEFMLAPGLCANYPDAVAFAVLIMNAAVPLLDRYTVPRIHGHPTR